MDNFQKNLLVAHAASHLDISLGKVTSTTIANYSRSFLGEHPSDCPDFLRTEAKISFKYAPAKFQKCDASVTVVRKYFMGDLLESPEVLLEELTYLGETAACSTTAIPRPFPRPCIPGYTC
ncbi:MAG TPA: hypothetical protein VNJ08_12290 [Bacteriovoracaceae bacterium]|nr:hypothetical protein [Bacteriovoracaceae bacterium]